MYQDCRENKRFCPTPFGRVQQYIVRSRSVPRRLGTFLQHILRTRLMRCCQQKQRIDQPSNSCTAPGLIDPSILPLGSFHNLQTRSQHHRQLISHACLPHIFRIASLPLPRCKIQEDIFRSLLLKFCRKLRDRNDQMDSSCSLVDQVDWSTFQTCTLHNLLIVFVLSPFHTAHKLWYSNFANHSGSSRSCLSLLQP